VLRRKRWRDRQRKEGERGQKVRKEEENTGRKRKNGLKSVAE
jgi:hypothetical protein